MIKFATIGSNFITHNFLKASASCSELQYEAVYSRNQKTATDLATQYNVRSTYTDLKELAQSTDIDAVYIASPTSLHYEQAKLMIEHGKHVLVEKPITSNENEALKLQTLAQQNNVVVLEALRAAYDPGFHKIKELLPSLGVIRQASLSFGKYSSRYDDYKNGHIENAFKPEFSNGALMDIGVYCIHPMVSLFGAPKSLTSSSIMLDDNLEGCGKVLATYDGFHVDVTYSKISNPPFFNAICGENGTMVIDSIQNPRKITVNKIDGETEEYTFDKPKSNMVYEAQIWADCILGKDSDTNYNSVSMTQMKVMDEIRKQQGIVFPADNI